MKFTCMRTDLSNAVSNVVRAVSTKGTIPALEGILIKAYNNKLVLSGYDLEIGITTTVDATVTDEGEIVVSAKLFSDIVRRLPEEIVCIETDDRLITYITSGQANYQIVGISSADFPELPTFEETDKIVIKAELLKNMIRQTIFAVSDNMAKPVYTGSLFDIEDKVLNELHEDDKDTLEFKSLEDRIAALESLVASLTPTTEEETINNTTEEEAFNNTTEEEAYNFYQYGFDELVFISAEHGDRIDELSEMLVKKLDF